MSLILYLACPSVCIEPSCPHSTFRISVALSCPRLPSVALWSTRRQVSKSHSGALQGTESHQAGVDVWIRDDEGGEAPAEGEAMWPQPDSPPRSPTQQADTGTPRNSTGDRVVPTAEPGGGSCSVANSALVDWMNDTASEAPAPVPEPVTTLSCS